MFNTEKPILDFQKGQKRGFRMLMLLLYWKKYFFKRTVHPKIKNPYFSCCGQFYVGRKVVLVSKKVVPT